MSNVKLVTISLSPEDEVSLKAISKLTLGKENKSAMVRMWINQNKHLIKSDYERNKKLDKLEVVKFLFVGKMETWDGKCTCGYVCSRR